MQELGQDYKVELLDGIEDNVVSVYRSAGFVDLCRGPHLPNTGRLGAFKLLSVAGAYWRGDSDRPQLQRVYGTAFLNEKELDDYLQRIEEAEKRDHRKLGRELDLFSFDEEIGQGLVLWHPRGAALRQVIEGYWTASTASAATSSSTPRTSPARRSTCAAATSRSTRT